MFLNCYSHCSRITSLDFSGLKVSVIENNFLSTTALDLLGLSVV